MKSSNTLMLTMITCLYLLIGCKKDKVDQETPQTNQMVLRPNLPVGTGLEFYLQMTQDVQVDWGDGKWVKITAANKYETHISGELKGSKITVRFSDPKDITSVSCSELALQELDVKALKGLKQLTVSQNQLKSIDVRNLSNLTFLNVAENQLSKGPIDELLNALPMRSPDTKGIIVIRIKNKPSEVNAIPSATALKAAELKNWEVLDYVN